MTGVGSIWVEPAPVGASTDFVAWMQPHVLDMTRFATRLVGPSDRDDVVQEALMSAWRKWGSYDAARGTPRTWLLAVVYDQARKSRRRLRAGPELIEGAHLDRPKDIDLERAIRALPARQRRAVELHYLLDLTVVEVAAVMACTPGTVKATLSHARAKLRRELGKESG